MKISRFIVNPFGENTYILWDKEGGEAIVVDPGMENDNERNTVDKFIADNGLSVQRVMLTHQHVDHILSAQYLSDKYKVPVCANEKDNPLGTHLPEQIEMFGLGCKALPLAITENMTDGDVYHIGDEPIKVLEVPGHSPGGLAFYLPESGCVIVGDSLFQMSIGRTDLMGGSYEQLIDSIKNKLLTLPDETVAYPGHGGATTIGDEKTYNPYIK